MKMQSSLIISFFYNCIDMFCTLLDWMRGWLLLLF